ncbi:MAG: hypothetical protein WBQ74_23395 [Candidatus Sulfotelmatobacter sp.]
MPGTTAGGIPGYHYRVDQKQRDFGTRPKSGENMENSLIPAFPPNFWRGGIRIEASHSDLDRRVRHHSGAE